MDGQKAYSNMMLNMERTRTLLGMSQDEFSEQLGLSLSQYQKMLYRRSTLFEKALEVILNYHELSGLFLYQMVDVSLPPSMRMLGLFNELNNTDKDIIEFLLLYIIQAKKGGKEADLRAVLERELEEYQQNP